LLFNYLGDFCFKKNSKLKCYEQAVTCFPEINKYELTDDVEFIIMGCDGIWDCVELQKFCEFISKNLKKSVQLNILLPFLMDKLLSKTRDCRFIIF
jgi:serine/threonine protein phosphatase PrpC